MPRSPARRGGAASIKGDPTMPRHERDFIAGRLEVPQTEESGGFNHL
jgi:hypothetical protein